MEVLHVLEEVVRVLDGIPVVFKKDLLFHKEKNIEQHKTKNYLVSSMSHSHHATTAVKIMEIGEHFYNTNSQFTFW